MIYLRKVSFGNPETIKSEHKSVLEALTEAYLDNWCSAAYIYTDRNLCGHRCTVDICFIECYCGIVKVKHPNESDLKQIYRFASNMCQMNCKVSVIFEDVVRDYFVKDE